MAPAPQDRLSPPGGAGYSSDSLVVGDGTWDLSRNTFLLPNLQGVNFDTMRYNGMGNRFASLAQYHRIVLAHAILAALVFLLIVPAAIMTARFYTQRPGYAVVFHAQMQILAGLMLLAVFILGYFAVGPSRSLTNPHHGIGVAIFVLFTLQLVGGRLVRHIVKMRSLRIMIHQWCGRAIALLGIVQVPLGLTLYGSPKYVFVLYTLWMIFLLLVYFALSYRSAGRRELYMSGGTAARSEAGRSRVTESEYLSNNPRPEPGSGRFKWLGPLAALGGLALASSRNKERARSRSRSRARSRSYSRGPAGDLGHSRRGSESYLSDKETELTSPRTGRGAGGGGGFSKLVGGAAAAFGVSKLVSGLTGRRRGGERDDDYSAVATETPRRQRSGRGPLAPTASEFSSDYTDNYGRRLHDGTNTSFLPPSANPPPPVAGEGRRPTTPRPMYARSAADRDESDYTSYVSPSRRTSGDRSGGGFAKGLLSGLGAGWFAKKMADRRSRREDARLRDEEEMRAGTHGPRYTGDGHPSPTRRSRLPTRRRSQTVSEVTESSINIPPSAPQHGRSRSNVEHVSMPPMPPDPDTPERRTSSRRRREGERAQAEAVARASDLAIHQGHAHNNTRGTRQPSPQGRPLSVKLKMHDDRDRNVTLRRLTEEEAARANRGHEGGHGESESSISGLESTGYGRRYRREPSQQGRMERAAERVAERKVRVVEEENDDLSPLSPPQPSFAKTARRNGGKDSAYYSGGGGGPSGAPPVSSQTASSGGSPDSHATWSQMTPSPAGKMDSAEDRRRRRRQERRAAASTTSRPSGQDMFE
ncbi:hypothetical protein CDD80_2428 [Ophiocordyceps camponoti-rufipedis]|uniref:Cytochrome b561 domain-containing protein n=1 Tax=Ophiocordyceps camponoti-rufipedis TaxID=2004952 RepID=A0A2C5ZGS9_9HYPO|nr:hypothetical protein CDD80_2428 [Ophiocordyceps camponoti-rufipedis]